MSNQSQPAAGSSLHTHALLLTFLKGICNLKWLPMVIREAGQVFANLKQGANVIMSYLWTTDLHEAAKPA